MNANDAVKCIQIASLAAFALKTLVNPVLGGYNKNPAIVKERDFMPTVFRYRGYRFFFYSNEGDPLEPLHIHVIKGEKIAKFWVEPTITVAQNYGMSPSELTKLAKIIADHKELIRESWDEYFNF